jgi:hypothetical protein
MFAYGWCVRVAIAIVVVSMTDAASAQDKSDENPVVRELVQQNAQLREEVDLLKSRVTLLEARDKTGPTQSSQATPSEITPSPSGEPPSSETQTPDTPAVSAQAVAMGGHTMEIPGGPALKIRGFLDFNFGSGTVANPLIYPLYPPTIPPTPVHSTFQLGEFDLFLSSRLSNSLSFLSEVVFGSDATNFWGIDVERAQLSYKPSDYFEISAGRMHTAIGFYNTAFHHGTWFQTATGRPFMYYFEDSGGILPVHEVGVSATGRVPNSGRLNLRWIAEVSNGLASSGAANGAQPVQNFLSDRNHKAFNLAASMKPDWVPGLQVGGNYYHDIREPLGPPHVENTIAGLYVVYITPVWEFLNELQVQRDRAEGSGKTFNTPLGYTQISRKFGKYRPYFRWQEVNVPSGDPLYSAVGRYEGPSAGLRFDFTDFSAFKIQYNRVYTRTSAPQNGVDGQVAFAF